MRESQKKVVFFFCTTVHWHHWPFVREDEKMLFGPKSPFNGGVLGGPFALNSQVDEKLSSPK